MSRKLREAELLVGEGKSTAEVAEVLDILREQFPPLAQPLRRLKADDAKRLNTAELRLDSIRLGTTLKQVSPP